MRILVTGANGFIGHALCRHLAAAGNKVVAAVRQVADNASATRADCDLIWTAIGDIGPDTDWHTVLDKVDAVVHLAARVHVMRDEAAEPLTVFRHINTDGTLNLARQAAQAGVRRFVFLSSVKVNGEETFLEPGAHIPGTKTRFAADDEPAPQDAYAISKWEAEAGLRTIANETGMEVVIIRPPLVYGPGVKGNFASMMRWVAKGVPLPLASVRHNQRSLVGLDNLIDLISVCLRHPVAANQVFMAGDGEDLSTAEMLHRLASALGRPSRLFTFPVWLLVSAASLLGKRDVARRLCGSLQVDVSRTRELLGWNPPVSVDEGFRRTVEPLLTVATSTRSDKR